MIALRRSDPGRIGSERTRSTPSARWRVVEAGVAIALIVASVATGPDRLIAFGAVALLGFGLEGVLERERPTSRTARSLAVDLTHAVGNRLPILAGVQLGLAVLVPVLGWVVPEAVPETWASLPIWLALPALFVVTDLFNYGVHRASHEVPVLWRFHRVHHSSRHIDWLATARGHPVDQVLAFVVVTIPAIVVGASTTSGLVVVALFVYPFVCHANISVTGGRLDALLVTPRFHHWHHAAQRRAINRNYGSVLSIWDRIFGTAVDAEDFPPAYGTPEMPDDLPSYLDHLTSPFRARGREAASAPHG